MTTVSILGSTGSIGRQTLDVCRDLNIEVNAICAAKNIDLLESQAREFNVKLVSVYDKTLYGELKKRLADTKMCVMCGQEGNLAVAEFEGSQTVITAMSGMIGLLPTVAAVKASKRIGLANKETLVCAGHIIMPLAKEYHAQIIPVDSEHSAIFQCLNGRAGNRIRKILLTASGGPFYGKNKAELENVTKEDALRHPNWSMGSKITIDSATLMNKGLEMIEAKWLFDTDIDDIEVLVHRESIIHSAVEFDDNSVIAQLGVPQMYLPIKYALTYPKRVASASHKLSLVGKTLHFDSPDRDTFRCLDLAVFASKLGGFYPTIMNAANEQAVALFLHDKIKFLEIADIIEKSINGIKYTADTADLNAVIEADRITRRFVLNMVGE
ncbi:MAG: 1-deoxy-D-xylulose-5-phosphate reductoisomerase [Clostridia bacterium]|nr:1-deoxy-D-xylulose-5-phosphate reductoisomerase [Clostridia bacterium]